MAEKLNDIHQRSKNNRSMGFLEVLMNNKYCFLLLFCVLVLFLALPNAKAVLETESYKEDLKTYTLKAWYGLDYVATAQLLENTDECGGNKECYFKINLSSDNKDITKDLISLAFYKKTSMMRDDNIVRNFKLEYLAGYEKYEIRISLDKTETRQREIWKEWTGENLGRNAIIKGSAQKDANTRVEWIPTLFSKFILDKWATWDVYDNLAAGKSATCSSIPDPTDGKCLFLTDEEIASGLNWYSNNAQPQWAHIDLGQAYYIYGIRIYHSVSGPTYITINFTLQYTDDNSTGPWTVANTTIGNADLISNHTLSSPISARYWSINTTKPGTADSITRIREFEIYGTSLPSVNVTLNSPSNNTNTSNTTVTFNCSASATGLTLKNITLYGDWSGGWHANETQDISGTTNSTIFTKNFSSDGSYKWNCLAYDTTGVYSDWDNNRTFMRDTIAPTITITNPIPNTLYNASNLSLNFSVSDIHLDSCWYSINNGTNTSIAGCANTTILTTATTNSIEVYVNDTASNKNSSRVDNVYVGMIAICGATATQPTLNFTLKDEGNSSLINGTIDIDFVYWISNQTANKTYSYDSGEADYDYNFTFCIYPNWASVTANYDAWYKSTGYPQRGYSDTSAALSNTTTQKSLYLLQSADGMYVRFMTTDKYNNPISGVTITMTNPQTEYTIEVEDTDDSGLGTFWVNPDTTYTFAFVKTGYTTQTKTMRPTSSEIYYVSMEGGEAITVNESVWAGIAYSMYPDFPIVVNNTIYSFRFNISDDTGNLASYSMHIYNASDVEIGSASGTNANGENLSTNIDIGGNKNYIYGIYNFTNSEGTIVTLTRKWKIEYYITEGGYSIWTFFVDLKNMTVGGFSDFTRLLMVFLLIFGITGFVSMNVGTVSVKGIMLMIIALVVLFGFLGMFEITGGIFTTMPSFMQKYLVPFIVIILGVGFIFLTWEKED